MSRDTLHPPVPHSPVLTELALRENRKDKRRELPPSAAVRALKLGELRLGLTFAGQARSWFESLKALVQKGGLPRQIIEAGVQAATAELDAGAGLFGHHPVGFDVMLWLTNEAERPSEAELAAGPLSQPLIFLTQIATFASLEQDGLPTTDIGSWCQVVAGHSQGILAALVAAEGLAPDPLCARAATIARYLVWQSIWMQRSWSRARLSPEARQGAPMLAVTGLDLASLRAELDLAGITDLMVALENGPDRFVLSGVPGRIATFAAHLARREEEATQALSRGKGPRRPKVKVEPLSVSAPFHSPFMADALEPLRAQAQRLGLAPDPSRLQCTVLRTDTGTPWEGEDLVAAMCVAPVRWVQVCKNLRACTHVLDLGPEDGVQALTAICLAGFGVRVVALGTPDGSLWLRDPDPATLARPATWADLAPRKREGRLENRWTRHTRTPPVFLPGMTPTTAESPLVGAAMAAGYLAELAGGGQPTEAIFRARANELRAIATAHPECGGWVLNTLYLDPHLWRLQVAEGRLAEKLRAEGHPIRGITISAGLPPVAEAIPLLERLFLQGIRDNALKVGSPAELALALDIADAWAKRAAALGFDPTLILQIEGGRAGGHHGLDELEPLLLAYYGRIRARSHILLAVGGGIDGPERVDTLLSGTWSLTHGRAPMPVDAVFAGTLFMAAAEALTSPAVKDALVAAPGLPALLSRGEVGGGVRSGRSGLGADIYYLDNAAGRLAATLDRLAGDPAGVAAKKAEIVEALSHTARPYVGDLAGTRADHALERVLRAFLLGNGRPGEVGLWLDSGHIERYAQFMARLMQRAARVAERNGEPVPSNEALWAAVGQPALTGEADLERLLRAGLVEPLAFFEQIRALLPTLADTIVLPEDEAYFLRLCNAPGKPVPFIPVIDGDIHRWYARDSLWQSHDPRFDADAVLVIPGPEALRGIRVKDLPAAQIFSNLLQRSIAHSPEAPPPRHRTAAEWRALLVAAPLLETPTHTGIDVRKNPLPMMLAAAGPRAELRFEATQADRCLVHLQLTMGTGEPPLHLCLHLEAGLEGNPSSARLRLSPHAPAALLRMYTLRMPRQAPMPEHQRFDLREVTGDPGPDATPALYFAAALPEIMANLLDPGLGADPLSLLHVRSFTQLCAPPTVEMASPTLTTRLLSRSVRDLTGGRELRLRLQVHPEGQPDVALAELDQTFLIRRVHTTLSADSGQFPEAPGPGVRLNNPRQLWSTTLQVPRNLAGFSMASGDHNPIHTDAALATLGGLSGPIAHGQWVAAAMLARLRQEPGQIRWCDAQFLAPVPLGARLQISARVVARESGDERIELEGHLGEGPAIRLQVRRALSPTALLFPGQGVQAAGMGMDTFARSAAARTIWETADAHTRQAHGFSLLQVVRENPRHLDIGNQSWRHPEGVLHLTQFTQVALTVLSVAGVAALREVGALPEQPHFAGHSVGEYSALAALSDIMPLPALVDVVYARGLTMQNFVARDADGRSDYQMGVVRPNRAGLDEAATLTLVKSVATESGFPLYVVNHNIAGRQYAVAGHRIAIAALITTLSQRAGKEAKGDSWVEIPGIDVPFHSPLLANGVPAFRDTVDRCIRRDLDLGPLRGRYIPNLVALPFATDANFVDAIATAIGEETAHQAGIYRLYPAGHPRHQGEVLPEPVRERAILVELLAWQFASPVRWIETQQLLLGAVERAIEVGPKASPVLGNMLKATLSLVPTPPNLRVLHAERDLAEVRGEGEAPSAPTRETPKPAASPTPISQTSPPSPSPTTSGPTDRPLSVEGALIALVALRTGKGLAAIDPSKSLDSLLGGNSARRNQLLLDLQEEFGSNAPDGAQDRPLSELAKVLAASGRYSHPGPLLRAAAAAGRTRLGIEDARIRTQLARSHGLGAGLLATVETVLAIEAPALAAGGQSGEAALTEVVERTARFVGIPLSPVGGTQGGAGVSLEGAGALIEEISGTQAGYWRKIAEQALRAAGLDPLLLDRPATPVHTPPQPTTRPAFDPERALVLEGVAAGARTEAWSWAARLVRAEQRGAPLPTMPNRLRAQRGADLARTFEALADRAERLPHRRPAPAPHGCPAAAAALRAAAATCRNAAEPLPYAQEIALLTGAGPGSIALSLVTHLLKGGATVIATTSRLDQKRRATWRQLYQEHAAGSASLTVLPFDQGEPAAAEALVRYLVHSATETQGGKTQTLRGPRIPTLFFPFAAMSAEGDPTDLGDTPEGRALEQSLSVNLLGVERLIGAFARAWSTLPATTPPLHCVLPLSPNHGQMGRDGLYPEAKAGLETLLARWTAEHGRWGRFVSLAGARIGWVRGTGLMSALDGVYTEVERQLSIQTFSTMEMATLLLQTCTPAAREQARRSPQLHDFSGGFGGAEGLRTLIDGALQRARGHKRSPTAAPLLRPLPMPDRKFPTLPEPKAARTIDPASVIVLVGMGEVGPFGNAEARWSVESSGALSLEAAFELAILLGCIKQEKGIWVDAVTGKPADLQSLDQAYQLRDRLGIRSLPPLPLDQRTRWTEVVQDEDQRFTVPDLSLARSFVAQDPDHTEILPLSGGSFQVVRRKGARIRVPRIVEPDRDVAGRLPEGWDNRRLGLSEDQIEQVDPVAQMNLIATAEALRSAGLTGAPTKALATLCSPARVACTQGSGIGGMRALRRLYVDPALDRPRQTDTLQETLINVTAAWPALALTGSAGPMLHPVGACATAALSVEAAVSLLRTGETDMVVAGAFDDIGPEGMQGFADMGATLSAAERARRGFEPGETSRPLDRRRAGFVEAQGGGTLLLCRADLALAHGLPIYGIIGGAWSAGDGLQRSVPAPGLGLLRIAVGGAASPLGQALARLGLEPDDIGAVSIHGTSTEANDKNEAELHQLIAESLGRSHALPLPIIAQKALSGHSKGGAAAWQLIGLAQTLIDDTLPALNNLEDPSPDLAARLPLVFPDRPTPASLGRAGLLTSLGFGHVGAAVLVAHPDVLLETLPPADLAAYAARREERWKARLVADAQIRSGLAPFVPPAGAPSSPERFVAELRAAGSPQTAQVQGGQNP